jgi:hypothetical protein
MLNLPRQTPPSWYRARILEELTERRTAQTPFRKLSETSDVFFSISRSQYDGFPVRSLLTFKPTHTPVYGYMLAKYTLRWSLYRVVAWACKADNWKSVNEVVNPAKDDKLDEVASRHRIDLVSFKRIASRVRWIWTLLP